MVYDKTANKLKFRTFDSYDDTDENLQPISVCVIPDNFLPDEISRWCYINDLTENGKSKFTWDRTITTDSSGAYISENGFVIPKYSPNVDNGAFYPIMNTQNDHIEHNEVQSWEDIGILPIDDGPFLNAPFVNVPNDTDNPESSLDPGCHWMVGYDNISVYENDDRLPQHCNMIPSPYIMDFGYYTFNPLYNQNAPEGTPANSALYVSKQGIRNTWDIRNCDKADDYEAVKACQNLRTPLMITYDDYNGQYSGSWYVPGATEMSCLFARLNTINASIVKCKGTPIAYDTIQTHDNSNLPDYQKIYDKYWTSTEASKNNAICINGYWRNENTPNGYKIGGQIGNGFKYWELSVRPFTLIGFKNNELVNVCMHYNSNNQNAFITLNDIFDISDFS